MWTCHVCGTQTPEQERFRDRDAPWTAEDDADVGLDILVAMRRMPRGWFELTELGSQRDPGRAFCGKGCLATHHEREAARLRGEVRKVEPPSGAEEPTVYVEEGEPPTPTKPRGRKVATSRRAAPTKSARTVEERVAVRQVYFLSPLFPSLPREDIAAVARAAAWLAARAYDASKGVERAAYIGQRVRWAVLHYAERELPAAMRVFGAVLRGAVRSGDRVAHAGEPVDPEALAGDNPGEDDLLDRLDRACTLQAVRHAVEALPRDERSVFLMRYQDGDTWNGIAAALGFSTGTAKRRASAALAKVQAALREAGVL
jgi:Sigma-70, region 4